MLSVEVKSPKKPNMATEHPKDTRATSKGKPPLPPKPAYLKKKRPSGRTASLPSFRNKSSLISGSLVKQRAVFFETQCQGEDSSIEKATVEVNQNNESSPTKGLVAKAAADVAKLFNRSATNDSESNFKEEGADEQNSLNQTCPRRPNSLDLELELDKQNKANRSSGCFSIHSETSCDGEEEDFYGQVKNPPEQTPTNMPLSKAKSLSSGDVNRVIPRGRKSSDPSSIVANAGASTDNSASSSRWTSGRFRRFFMDSFGKGKLSRKRQVVRQATTPTGSSKKPLKAKERPKVSIEVIGQPVRINPDMSKAPPEPEVNVNDNENNRVSIASQDSGASVNSHCSSNSMNSDYTDLDPESGAKGDKVFLAAREFMTTEKTFVGVVHMLDVTFREFIVNQNQTEDLVPASEFVKVFSNLKDLLVLNSDFLRDFTYRVENWDEHEKIADVMVKKGDFLKLFATYVEEYQRTSVLFDDLLDKYPKFKTAVKEFEVMPVCQNLNLASYFLKPVQRLPQYKLLFENYIKYLPHGHVDYKDAVKALEIVSKAANHANQLIAKNVNFKKLLTLQTRLCFDDLIRPDRELIREGQLNKICRNTIDSRYLVLLNDVLIVAKPISEDNLKIHQTIYLGKLSVKKPEKEDEYPLDFHILSAARSFTLRASSVCERDTWISSLNKSVEEYKRRRATFAQAANRIQEDMLGSLMLGKLGDSAPIWVPDERVTMCQKCHCDFTFFLRRHHCRACGQVVCYYCSAQKAPLKYRDYKPERVCYDCYDTLLGELGEDEEMRSLFETRETTVMLETLAKPSKKVPTRLKLTSEQEEMSGYLYVRDGKTGRWRRNWFVLASHNLYQLKAAADSAAERNYPILGYTLEPEYILERTEKNTNTSESLSFKEGKAFRLTHTNCEALLFYSENENTAQKWINALFDAVRLS